MDVTLAPLWSGIAAGAFSVTALSVWGSDLGRDAKLTTGLTCLSATAWVLMESGPTSAALGRPYPLVLLAFPTAGFFWAMVRCVFEDRRLRAWAFAPAGLLLALGTAITLAPAGWNPGLSAALNLTAAALCLHAGWTMLRSWRGDLVESRRSTRLVVLGIVALYAAAQGARGVMGGLSLRAGLTPSDLGGTFGGAAVAALAVAMAVLFLQARRTLFAAPSPGRGADPKLIAAERVLLAKLEAFMATEAWREEGLSIGATARALGTPEHRLRRLINARQGYRNFADFVNGYRIAAAKARLADPEQATLTVAAIAYDLGFGSLSPFNRAFRATTGATPTAWRRDALGAPIAARAD